MLLKPQHLDEERQLAAELHDKKSAKFHRFLTAEQWKARFAPSAQDEQAVADWAQSQGLTITHRYPNRLLVDAEGTAGTIEKALGITINNYAISGKPFFSNDREPMLPANLASTTVWAGARAKQFGAGTPGGQALSKRLSGRSTCPGPRWPWAQEGTAMPMPPSFLPD